MVLVPTTKSRFPSNHHLITRNLRDQLQRRKVLLKAPENICLLPPSHSQHAITKQFESYHEEKVFTEVVDILGYSLAGMSTVDYMGVPFEIPSPCSQTREHDHSCEHETYCSTVQYFIMPLASWYLSDDQLQLSDDAIKSLKAIEKLIDSRDMSLQYKCEEFFRRFGSHTSKGPIHFGGTYKWVFHSLNYELSYTKVVQKLQNDITQSRVRMPVFHHVEHNPYSVKYDGDYCELLNKSFQILTTSGGPQGVLGLPGWKTGLIASNKTWIVIDRGTTLVPVWDIIKSSHKNDFEKPYSLATLMNEAWNTINQYYPDQDEQDPIGKVENIIDLVTSCNKMLHSKKVLNHLEDVKQDVTKQSMRPRVWASVYLSQPAVQKFLKSVVNQHMKQTSTKCVLPEDIKEAIKRVVDPLDLDAVRDFECRKHLSRWVYCTECSPVPMGYKNILSLHSYFRCALNHLGCSSARDIASICYQPNVSTKVTISLAKVVSCFTSHLKRTGQKYEETFVITVLLPFNYDPDQHLFLTSFSVCDLEYLSSKFGHHCKQFFNIIKQKNSMKSQAYLFLLALELHNDLYTSDSHMTFCLQCIEQMICNDIEPQVKEILVQLRSKRYEWGWLQSQLECVTSDKKKERLVSLERKAHCEEFFSVLGLMDFYPQRLTLHHALEIRGNTIEGVKATVSSAKNGKKMKNETMFTDPRLYPFVILQKIMAFDYKCRLKLVLSSESVTTLSMNRGDKENRAEVRVHPMDGLLAVLHCADNFLRQDLMSRLATCQLAVPLLLPDPFEPQKVTFLIWAMRSIVRDWKLSNGTTKEGQLVNYPSPLVSFVRIGEFNRSKSHVMNTIIESKHNTFFHYNCSGGCARQLLVKGLVEMCWYLPPKIKTIFTDLISFANLHGDARDCPKQVEFLSMVSFMSVIFVSGNNRNAEVFNVLQKLSKAPGGILILQVESPDDERKWHAWLKPIMKSLQTISMKNMNDADICEAVQKKIQSNINEKWDDASKHLPLEKHCDAARSCNIFVDEDEEHCLKGKELAYIFTRIIHEYRRTHVTDSLRNLLPLQGCNLWQKWALTEKEHYRQTQREQCDIEVYAEQQRKIMSDIRKKQFNHTQFLHPLMAFFLNSLLTHQGKIEHYFLQWIQLFLNNLAREQLPSIHTQYKEELDKLRNIQSLRKKENTAEQTCKEKIQKLTIKMVGTSFGLEHLLREVGQIYEAVAEQDGGHIKNKHILCLPKVAAELMIEGYPLELMDGDAAHVPTLWVSAVLSQVQYLLGEAKLFVISVLGVQSSGKSTLLNTVFGVRFSTSAGRCTRGAFMQLLPIHSSLRQLCKCDYFLIVDTEGLRTPEMDDQQRYNHDNELATFVIGLANLTIINLSGETMGEMDDILQTTVHAFLRMRDVRLSPKCHFVHQNVTALTAGDKTMTGTFMFTQKLDEITRAAAKQEEKEELYTCFKHVIDFNSEEHVLYFQNLWEGDPPMAPINPGYSNSAQFLKAYLINCAKPSTNPTAFRRHLKALWKAILHENFVFSFRNTLEVTAYNALDGEYNKWSWEFKREMMTWEHKAHNQMKSCEIHKLSTVYRECHSELPQLVQSIHQGLQKKMNAFFEGSSRQDIIKKWKEETKNRLTTLRRKLQEQAESHCDSLKANRETLAEVEKMKVTHRKEILGHVKLLVSQLEKGTLDDKQLEERFDSMWVMWIEDVKSQPVHVEEVTVKEDVQLCIIERFRSAEPIVLKKLQDRPLEKWGPCLRFEVTKEHVKKKAKYLFGYVHWSSEYPIKEAQQITDELLEHQRECLEEMKQKHYNRNLATELLHKLFEGISHHSTDITFTEEYRIDMAITVCGYAFKIFQEMVNTERKSNDPVEYLEREMKQPLLKIFKDGYYKTAQEVTAAWAVCALLKTSVKKEVIASLSQRVVDGMRGSYSFLHTKPALKAKVLFDIGNGLREQSENHFAHCLLYLRDVKRSLRFWIDFYTAQYCNEGNFERLAFQDISKNVELIIQVVHRVSKEFSLKKDNFKITDWLAKFYSEVQQSVRLQLDMTELLQLGGVHELSDISHFKEEVMKGLENVEVKLRGEFEAMTQEEIQHCVRKACDHLNEALAGCAEQCPFCKEQCDLTNPDHYPSTKHSVALHRPECLGNYRWHESQKMVLDICTTSVASDCRFRNCDTEEEWQPYKEYAKFYPQWSITADRSLEASLYWKWLLGKYAVKIAKEFGMKETEISSEWRKLEWSRVKESLEDAFNV